MRHCFLLYALLLSACSLTARAQTAREVLDATATLISGSGVRAQFKATQFNGTTPQEETTGTMQLHGRRFQMQTPDMTLWYDGQTQWSMLRGADEVNVTEPTEEERAALNPSALMGIYKQGYSLKLRKATLRGKPTYEVRLKAKNKKAAFTDIYVDVEQATYRPLCFRAKKDGNWMRLSILSFENGLTLPDAAFTFPEKDYPDVEVIDLR